jgi:Flp pilus assembly protein TadD
MNRHILIIVGIAIVLTAFLYSRPKIVVKDEAKANRDKVTENKSADNHGNESADNHGNETEEIHAPKLTVEQQKKVSVLKQKLISDKNSTKILDELAAVYATANRFDSAAYYIEQIALKEPNINHWMRTGDAYYQAFTLALKPENLQMMAEKTQNAYKKVLELNPRQLQAKTNMAMTYVQSGTPMQAIGLLREVLDEEPNFEPALMNLGVLSMQSNQFDKAADRFQQVLRNNPKNTNAQLGLGYSLIELGKKPEARKVFEDLKNKVKDPTLLEEINKALESLK